MNIKELMVGNYLLGEYEENEYELCTVLTLDSTHELCEYHLWAEGSGNHEYYQSFKPVPISIEYLKKLGFEESHDNVHGDFQKKGLLIRKVIPEGVCVFSCKESDMYWNAELNTETDWVSLRRVDYVHEVQNLYFSLYNEKLRL